MIDKDDHTGRKRLHDELKNLNKEPLFNLGCTVGLNNDDNIINGELLCVVQKIVYIKKDYSILN